MESAHAFEVERPAKTVDVFWLVGARDDAKRVYVAILGSYLRREVEDNELQRETGVFGL